MSSDWREWIIWPLSIGSMLVGGLGIIASHRWSFPSKELLGSLGDAVFIAGFLSMTVDQYVKKHLLHEVAHDVTKYLIGYGLPPEAQDRIKELMACRLVREYYVAHYVATRLAAPGRLKLTVTISYYVKNITHRGERYQQRLQLEQHDSPEIIELKCESSDPKAKYRVEGKSVSAVSKGVIEACGPTITVRSQNKADLSYRISDTHSLIQPEEYSDLISFLAPTINVKIIADFPPDITFLAPLDEETEHPSPNIWEYTRLFMPTEHIRLRWFKKNKALEGGKEGGY